MVKSTEKLAKCKLAVRLSRKPWGIQRKIQKQKIAKFWFSTFFVCLTIYEKTQTPVATLDSPWSWPYTEFSQSECLNLMQIQLHQLMRTFDFVVGLPSHEKLFCKWKRSQIFITPIKYTYKRIKFTTNFLLMSSFTNIIQLNENRNPN